MNRPDDTPPEEHAYYEGRAESVEEIRSLKAEIEQLRNIFRHTYVQKPDMNDRFCQECGLYLTDPIHKTVEASRG